MCVYFSLFNTNKKDRTILEAYMVAYDKIFHSLLAFQVKIAAPVELKSGNPFLT